MSNTVKTHLSRRNFLRHSMAITAGAGLALSAPINVFAKSFNHAKSLKLYNIHTGEKVNTTFWENGIYLPDSLAEINKLLRDHRTGEIVQIDTKILELVHLLANKLNHNRTFEIISGYRSPKTNAQLRKADHKGVAKKSYHMKARAIDLRLPGVDLSHLRQAAIQLKMGGVGFYPKSNFVHLDTGRVRQWKAKS
ncbi:MAG: DUF882 domain-containing protein [Gammaproteobacteria bacterium]|nr:DUF882 domain-containing protein [Gammaproteobacteria bacterium]MDH5730368.1 DUF882 domain-containing protein [Gammaproteobacteria bacterium]